MSTYVRLDRLSQRYRGAPSPTVDDVTLDVPAGSLTALLGPSGCGKTTTLKVVAGLLDADAGDVTFDGDSVLALPPERRSAAMVFQQPLLFPRLSVGENVAFGLRVRRVPRDERRARVEEMLALVRLEGYADRPVAALSGGQEQRVALARALVVEPRVLLLDEPLSQLDAGLRVEMRDLVRRVQREVGVTTLFVTHDQEEAVALSDRVALMLDGRLAQEGDPHDFYRTPAGVEVARFFGARNLLPGEATGGLVDVGAGAVRAGSGATDGPVVLVVRPETVRVLPSGAFSDPMGSTLPARVVEARFLGTTTAVVLALDGPAREPLLLHASVPPGEEVAVGAAVQVVVPRAGAHAVAAPSSA